jgi:hypothetical protein
MRKPEYPEHEKLALIKDQSQAIGEFIEWLHAEKGIQLGKYVKGHEFMAPAGVPKEKLLSEFFEIDLDKLESEKCKMLDEQRALNRKRA